MWGPVVDPDRPASVDAADPGPRVDVDEGRTSADSNPSAELEAESSTEGAAPLRTKSSKPKIRTEFRFWAIMVAVGFGGLHAPNLHQPRVRTVADTSLQASC